MVEFGNFPDPVVVNSVLDILLAPTDTPRNRQEEIIGMFLKESDAGCVYGAAVAVSSQLAKLMAAKIWPRDSKTSQRLQ
ncbi:MAG: hypothetical protein NTY19_03005 [Planctomycetota bacterium]|nr:hypothetical protein [Planctomycetota bacterium]